MSDGSRPQTPADLRLGSRPATTAADGRPGTSEGRRSPSSLGGGRGGGVDPVQQLIMGLSNRLGRIEAMVESAASADSDGGNDAATPAPPSDGSRPATKEGDRKLALSSSSFAAAQSEAAKPNPSMPTITRTIFKELSALSARVKRFEDTNESSKAFQDQKDKAQDEMLAMEIERINDDIKGCVAHLDLDALEKKFKLEMKAMRTELEERQDKQALRIANEVGAGVRTLREQVKVINEANKGIMDNLDGRVKKLEKDVFNAIDDLEQRARELIEETVERAVSELRTDTQASLGHAQEALAAAASHIASVERRQLELKEESGGATVELASNLEAMGAKMSELLDGSYLKELILSGSAPAVDLLGKKMDAELMDVQVQMRAANDAAAAATRAMEERLAGDAVQLREVVGTVFPRLDTLDGALASLDDRTAHALGGLSDAVERNAASFEATTTGIKEGVAAAQRDLLECRADAADLKRSLALAGEAAEQRAAGGERRLAALEAKEPEQAAAVAALGVRLGACEAEATRVAGAVVETDKGVTAGARLIERIGAEAQTHRRALDGALNQVAEDLTARLDEDRAALVGLEAKAEEQAAITVELRDSFSTLVTKESFWDVMEKRSAWHADRLAKYCNDTESTCSSSAAPRLTGESQKHMSGHAQRIAKVIAAKADATVLESMVGVGVPKPEQLAGFALQWDEKVDSARDSILAAFVGTVEKVAKRNRPRGLGEDVFVLEARKMFLETLKLALRLALSKFTRVLPAETMLGTRGLAAQNGACAACARPFGRDNGPGDRRGAAPEGTVEKGMPLASDHSVSRRMGHSGDNSVLSSDQSLGSLESGQSLQAAAATRNPFKQSRRKKGSSGGGVGEADRGLHLGSIGEWDDAASVSSMASNASRMSAQGTLPAL